MKIQKKNFFLGGSGGEVGGGGGLGGRGRVGGGGGQGGCERRTEVFVKIQEKKIFFFLGGGGVGLGGGGGVRVDVNQELKFFGKFKKKNWGGGEGGSMGGVRVWGSGWM